MPIGIYKRFEMTQYTEEELYNFLSQSNYIEGEDDSAYSDSRKAWDYLIQHDSIGFPTILNTHNHLMKNLNSRIAGEFRSCNVRVGYKLCPDWTLVSGLLYEWLRKYGDYTKVNTEELIKQAHIEFEGIHPFEDGNGRTGRLIMNWHRVKNNLPLLIINIGDEQMEYYKWFR